MRRPRGFTLIELTIVVAVVGILATAAIVSFRAGSRNANLSSATYELAMRISGMRTAAIGAGRDRLLVFVDAPGSDSSTCYSSLAASCTRYFVLSNPGTGWSLATFNPATPAGSGTATAELVQSEALPRGVHLDFRAGRPALPAPFDGIAFDDADLLGTCGSRSCFAVRFTARGEVLPEYAGAARPTKAGHAFVLGTTLGDDPALGERRALLVSFPAGITKTYAF
jgi:prepilin-type N-terminal cleavage/methylation domain-containing protein